MSFSCKEASRLASDSYERKLTAVENIKFRVHLLICGMCRNYKADLEALRNIAARLNAEPEHFHLPEADRERIRQFLEQHSTS